MRLKKVKVRTSYNQDKYDHYDENEDNEIVKAEKD